MSEPFVAEIRLLPYNFAPRGWALCDGQLLPITQNTALFSLLGTTYGGDGRSTFALPDFRGRAAMGHGQGPGLTGRSLGESGGSESVALTLAQMPLHSHLVHASVAPADSGSPSGRLPAVNTDDTYAPLGGKKLVDLPITSVGASGQGAPHNNLQPYLVLQFAIALQGIFPARQ